jgi:hypothetical protein
MRFRVPAFVVIAAAVSFIACQEKTSPTAPSDGDTPESPVLGAGTTALRLQSVTVSPAADTIGVGQTVQLTATPNPPATVTFVWKSKNTNIATVDQNGLVTAGVKLGKVTIEAKAGGKTGKATIWVVAAPPPPPPPPPPDGSPVLVGAGDIASCSSSGDEATALLLDGIAGTVFTVGDNVYDTGTAAEFNNCYEPSWGRHKARTRPSIGNHDYATSAGAPYYAYFAPNAAGPDGYYSYNLGDWHIIVLNSNIARTATSAQGVWLKNDLIANTKSCTLAYWHHPRFSSGATHGSDTSLQPFWQLLYDYNADVVLSGHDHDYERFAPQTPTGAADSVRGIREFVVGTGGRSHYGLGSLKANSQMFNGDTYGVLKLTLGPVSYSWEFVPVAGKTFTDSGIGGCH